MSEEYEESLESSPKPRRDEIRDSMNWSIGKRRFWLNSRIAGFWLARSCERVETRR